MLNVNKHTKNQQSTLRTAHVRVHIIVYNCITQHSIEYFW